MNTTPNTVSQSRRRAVVVLMGQFRQHERRFRTALATRAMFVRLSKRLRSITSARRKGIEGDGQSVIALMSVAAGQAAKLLIVLRGQRGLLYARQAYRAKKNTLSRVASAALNLGYEPAARIMRTFANFAAETTAALGKF
jgi:phosphotransferase system HPr-like phosphotransfer protein